MSKIEEFPVSSAPITFDQFQKLENKVDDRFVKVEDTATTAKKVAEDAKAAADVATLAVGSKVDDNRVKVLINERAEKDIEAAKSGFLKTHANVLTVINVVLSAFGLITAIGIAGFNSLQNQAAETRHAVLDARNRSDDQFKTLTSHFDDQFKTMNARFDEIAPPRLAIPSSTEKQK